MASTPEGKVKAAIRRLIGQFQCYLHMPVQNGMGKPTLDFIGCKPTRITPEMVGKTVGLFFAVEAKAPGKKPTERQLDTIADMQAAGAKVFIIASSQLELSDLHVWLNE